MEDYPSNSNKSKEMQPTERKVEKIISGQAKVRKRSELRKFTDIFLPEDVEDVKTYIIRDVIIPKVRDMLHDIGAEAWDSLWGIKGGSSRSVNASHVSYRQYYDKKNKVSTPSSSSRVGYGFRPEDTVLESRGEAEDVLTRMDEMISMYGTVSIADFKDMCGVTPLYTDNKYGWTDVRSASIVRIREGYVIKMSRPMPLD